ncbi:MAG: ABC transporter ATP-binding protein [Cytophagia bacterium]|nr:MAG: ABC transporter ATP-binding protein [Runella sp.]TAG19634.1 MAG: ABC transporter ATP-binding protein [Cytophagales bacterium]TAG40205.1 MAG: ABC transporter ATP-binding protein [Cytophagia bacterium]TAG75527.1 MAG: ABC transporter ATP-binding protein [Runella slithyformis]TAG80428.1 MAG: ABC transporter ATP-binding protein [Cytophagales bacterium]
MKHSYKTEGTVLLVENVSVTIGNKTIIENINMEEHNTLRDGHAQGQMIAVVGRSGRGKSTLFKTITGLRKPSTGRILIPSNEINKPIEVQEGTVGFVDQKYTLFRHLTIYNQLKLAARKGGIPDGEIHGRVMDLLNKWGLEKAKDQYPCHCSGGQRQRAAIMSQLLSSGYFLVLDEPFSGLDVGNVEDVKSMLRLVNTSHELSTIIFSTHDIELAVELADKIYVLGFASPSKQVGTVVASFDLKALGLAWQPYSQSHTELAKDIKTAILGS